MTQWIWQQVDWPQFTWDAAGIFPYLVAARSAQGLLLGVVQPLQANRTRDSVSR
jgi:Fic family protein